MNDVTDDALLRAIHEHGTPSALTIGFNEVGILAAFPTVSGRQLDVDLQAARDESFLAGDRAEGDGSVAYWSDLRLTVDGLQRLGEWPPAGKEHQSGPWNDRWFGRYARPLLEALAAQTDDQIVFQGDPLSIEDRRRWLALHHLIEAGLVLGNSTPGAFQDVRIVRQTQQH